MYYYAIVPNFLLSLHPDYVMTHTLWPRAVDRTDVICEWHFHPDETAKPNFEADDAVEFWDITNREDWLSQSFRGQESSPALIDPVLTRAVSPFPTLSIKWCWIVKSRRVKNRSGKADQVR